MSKDSPNPTPTTGIKATGLVMSKKHTPAQEKGKVDAFHLSLAIEGLRAIMEIKVSQLMFDAAQQMQIVSVSAVYNEWNGKQYWSAV